MLPSVWRSAENALPGRKSSMQVIRPLLSATSLTNGINSIERFSSPSGALHMRQLQTTSTVKVQLRLGELAAEEMKRANAQGENCCFTAAFQAGKG
jgi:hypothetical protein